MNHIVRAYKKEDKQQVEELINKFEDYLARLDDMKRLAFEDKLSKEQYGKVYLVELNKKIKKNNGIIYIIEEKKRVMGFVAATIFKPNKIQKIEQKNKQLYGYIEELYLHENIRGKGIGTLLIKKAEEYLKNKNCTCITLNVFAPNKKARGFYEKHGYIERSIEVMKEIK